MTTVHKRILLSSIIIILLSSIIILSALAGVEIVRVRRVMMQNAMSGAFEMALESGKIKTSNGGVTYFDLPLRTTITDGRDRYLRYLESGHYVLVSYRRSGFNCFTVLRLGEHDSEFICSGFVR